MIFGRGQGYRIMRACVWFAMWPMYRIRVEGLENVPREGGALLVANHQSMLDIPLIGTRVRRTVTFVARDTLRKNPFLRWVIHTCGGITVKRGSADRAALDAMIAELSAGKLVAIFPEGTRSRDGSVRDFQRGALLVAKRAGVPVIPMGVAGTGAVWPSGRPVPGPGRLGLALGEPLPPRTDAAEVKAAVETLAERAREHSGARRPRALTG